MKPKYVIGAIVVGGIGWLLWLHFSKYKQAPTVVRTATVTAGTPTVTGSSATAGGTDYTVLPMVDAVTSA